MKRLSVIWLLISLVVFSGYAKTSSDAGNKAQATAADTPSTDIKGDWFAQIDIPQNDLTILLEFNITDGRNCVVTGKWFDTTNPAHTEEESGRATYTLDGNRLTITFLNADEVIETDNVFDLVNVYDIRLENGRLTIVDNPQFRNVDVNFGRGYDNRGFAKIIFDN